MIKGERRASSDERAEGRATARRPRLSALLLILGLLAQAPRAAASATDIDPRLYDPSLSPTGLLAVDSSLPVGHLRLWGSLIGSWANDELVTRRGSAPDALDLGPLRNRLITTVAAGVGLFDRLDLALGLPLHLTEEGAFDDGTRERSFGLGDLRLVARLRAFGPAWAEGGVGLALLVDATLPTGGDAHHRGDTAPTLTPRLALDYRGAGGLLVALNLGYRLRPAREIGDLTVGDELRFGVGAELPLGLYELSALVEIDGALGLEKSTTGDTGIEAREVPIEARGGLRWRSPSGLTLSGALGAGLTKGYGAPDYRVILSLSYGGPTPPAFEEPLVDASGVVVSPTEPPSERGGAEAPNPSGSPPDGHPAGLDPSTFDQLTSADLDGDSDGVPTPADRCPSAAEDRDGFQDDDGCPDPDNDGDGVLDAADRCPEAKEVINGVDDDDGCPDEAEGPAAVTRVGEELVITEQIRFLTNSAELTAAGEAVLDQVARVMKAAREVRRFRIEGHTDYKGDREFNVDLSERRARSVRRYLIAKGVRPERLFPKGYGATRPIAKNTSKAGRAKNRRVEFHIIAPGEEGWEDEEGAP